MSSSTGSGQHEFCFPESLEKTLVMTFRKWVLSFTALHFVLIIVHENRLSCHHKNNLRPKSVQVSSCLRPKERWVVLYFCVNLFSMLWFSHLTFTLHSLSENGLSLRIIGKGQILELPYISKKMLMSYCCYNLLTCKIIYTQIDAYIVCQDVEYIIYAIYIYAKIFFKTLL